MNIIDNVLEIVKKDILKYKNEALDHYDFWNEHIKYVYEESISLAKKYGADVEIVSLGAFLHDIALIRKVGSREDHHINGKMIAEEILNSLYYPEDKRNRVLNCVYNHRSSKNANTLEERCVADADVLAHFDNVLMLIYSLIVRGNAELSELRRKMKEVLIKDYNDLSDETKKDYYDKFKNIYLIVVGEEYE